MRRHYGFVPDHVTVNILMKAYLRTRTEVDATRARELFDVLVRRGYPGGAASPGGMQSAHTPFGTNAATIDSVLATLDIPNIEAPLLYKRHVLPLYKMFVKVFYLRGDVAAARRVVGILKALEVNGWTDRRQAATTETR